MEQRNQSMEPSLREQCITASIAAALVTTDTRRYTPKELVGFLLIAQANLETTDHLKEVNPRLYRRNVEAAALVHQITLQERGEQFSSDLNGLLLVAAAINANNRHQVQIHVICNDQAWCIMATDTPGAKEWLGEDARRLVRWDATTMTDDGLSGLYVKPSFQIPPWILHWDASKDLDTVKDRKLLESILGVTEGERQSAVEEAEGQECTQIWFCERCRVVSSFAYREEVDVKTIFEAVGAHHQTASPGCSSSPSQLRVVNPSILVSQATLDTDPTIPAWAKERLALVLFGPKVGDTVSVPPARSDEYEGTVGTIASQVSFDPFDHTPVCLVRLPGYGPTIVFAVSDLRLPGQQEARP